MVIPLPPGDIWQCLGTFLEDRGGIYRVEANGATKSSTMHRIVPHNKELSPQMSVVLKFRDPGINGKNWERGQAAGLVGANAQRWT